MLMKSPGTMRPATPRTSSTEIVTATRPVSIRRAFVICEVRASTNMLSTSTWLRASSATATLERIVSTSVTAVSGRNSAAMAASTSR
jgi:hypothetical protein